jgi:broad specificity phosphatase PhoE
VARHAGIAAAPTGAAHLVVVRHGRTAWNAEDRFQGHADPGLDGTGLAQAEMVAAALAVVDPALIVSSDLRRARQTAAPLSVRCGRPVTFDPALREVDVGRWAGLTRAEVADRFPAEWAAWRAGSDVARGGGETAAVAGERAAAALSRAVAACPAGGTVVAVGHGIALQYAMGRLDAAGVVALGGAAPHLGNGAWRSLAVTAPALRAHSPGTDP